MKLERIFASPRPAKATIQAKSPKPRIVVFGDSHVHALQEALTANSPESREVPIEARRLLKTKLLGTGAPPTVSFVQRLQRSVSSLWQSSVGSPPDASHVVAPQTLGDTTFAEFLTVAASMSPDDFLVSAVGGNQHAVFSTIQHPVAFDFHFPDEHPAPVYEGIEVVPYGPLYAHFRNGLREGDGATLAALKKATPARLIHLMAPPPKRSGDYIARHHDTHFASEGIATLGVSSAALRMKFWKLQNRALAEICDELGIELLAPPGDACDEDGFLGERFYAGDATHANIAYGRLVIDQLERLAMQAQR